MRGDSRRVLEVPRRVKATFRRLQRLEGRSLGEEWEDVGNPAHGVRELEREGRGSKPAARHGPPESGNPTTPKPYTATGGESLERKPFRQGCGEESHPRVFHETCNGRTGAYYIPRVGDSIPQGKLRDPSRSRSYTDLGHNRNVPAAPPVGPRPSHAQGSHVRPHGLIQATYYKRDIRRHISRDDAWGRGA